MEQADRTTSIPARLLTGIILAVAGIAVLLVVLAVRPSSGSGSEGQEVPGGKQCPSATVGAAPPSPRTSSGSGDVDAAGAGDAGLPLFSANELAFGLATEGGFGSPWQWDDVSRAVSESPSLIMAYANFTEPLPFSGLESVAARGATPVITWEPWIPEDGDEQSRFSLASISAGDHDTYLHEWAGGLRAYDKPVILRFAHEMNYPWYPWGAGTAGNSPEAYVSAWRHIHGIFDAVGAYNVSWAWNPQAPECGSSFEQFYPGGDVVDLVALDGYNWGTSRADEQWRSPVELFGEGIRQARELAPGKPIIIGETASAEAGGSKAEWISELVRYLAEQPDVAAFVWFDYQKEADWRITSSSGSQNAFETALSSR